MEPTIEEVARRWLDSKTNSIQALAESLGITRQTLNTRVKSFLESNPGFEDAYLKEKAASGQGQKSA